MPNDSQSHPRCFPERSQMLPRCLLHASPSMFTPYLQDVAKSTDEVSGCSMGADTFYALKSASEMITNLGPKWRPHGCINFTECELCMRSRVNIAGFDDMHQQVTKHIKTQTLQSLLLVFAPERQCSSEFFLVTGSLLVKGVSKSNLLGAPGSGSVAKGKFWKHWKSRRREHTQNCLKAGPKRGAKTVVVLWFLVFLFQRGPQGISGEVPGLKSMPKWIQTACPNGSLDPDQHGFYFD